MRLFIRYDDGNTEQVLGSYQTIEDAEKAFIRVTNRPTTFAAQCWNTNDDGEALGGPIMNYEREGSS
jgi:hypothetical protein